MAKFKDIFSMEQDNRKIIDKALKFIKDKRLNEARNLLLEVLNNNAEHDHAWYLLSFTLPNKDRQIYALNQALKINRSNWKAKSILNELQHGNKDVLEKSIFLESDEVGLESVALNDTSLKNLNDIENDEAQKTIFGTQFNSIQEPDIPSYLENQDKGFADEPDLLSQRLPGLESLINDTNSEITKPEIMDNKISELRNEIDNKNEKKKRKSKAKKRIKKIHKKLPDTKRKSIRRNIFLIIAIIISVGGYFLYTSGFFDSNIEDQIIAIASDIFSPTNTIGPTNTQNPPTATIVPTGTERPEPTETRLPIKSPTPFPTATVFPMNAIVEAQINAIQGEIEELRGLSPENEAANYLVNLQYLRNVLKGEFDKDTIVKNSVIESEVLQLLGLNNTSYSLVTHSMNAWVEARGGLYIPDSNAIFFTGLNFNSIEKYVYVQEYLQFLVDDNFGIKSLSAYPTCFDFGQACQAAQSLIKGDAKILSNLWVEEYLSASDKNSIENLLVQNYLIPASLPPSYSSQDLSFFNSYGFEFVNRLYEEGGWGAINSAYLDPPSTTEQIMHPIKYLLKEGAIEINEPPLNMILGDEWEEIKVNDLGEWRTYLVLAYGNNNTAQLENDIALEAAEGWGGDIYQYYKNDFTGETVISVHWVMDTELDSIELMSALKFHLANKFGKEAAVDDGIHCWENRVFSCIQIFEDEVFWVKTPSKEMAKSIFELFLAE